MATVGRILSSSNKGAISSLRTVCVHLSQNLKRKENTVIQNISTTPYALKVLSQSTIFIQDGIDIKELPVLIRHADKESFPFTSHSYTGENIREVNEFEISFKQELQNCVSVIDVFKLLEVPPDKVEGYSAAFSLLRLHTLMHLNTDWLQIHSFIRTAVMKELYEIVERDIQLISNVTLIGLVDCYIAAQGFSPSCLDAINDEISARLVEGVFSVEELLYLIQSLSSASTPSFENIFPSYRDQPSLSEVLFENASKFLSSEEPKKNTEPFDKFMARANPATREKINQICSEIKRNAWIHLSSRYQEMDEYSLPMTLQLLPPSQKNFVHLLEKPLASIWYNLTMDGVAACLDSLYTLRIHNAAIMTRLGQWAYVNVHQITPQLLLSYLNVYTYFSHADKNIINVMERCLQKSGINTPTHLLALCVEYTRSFNYTSPIIMDLAAEHFTNLWESYEPLEIYAILRTFGHLQYLPQSSQDFLKEAEKCLFERFNVMEEAQLLEVLASFTFVGVFPKNFFRQVSSDEFHSKIGSLSKANKLLARRWLKVLKQAVALSSSSNMEINRKWVLSRRSQKSIYSLLETERIATMSLKNGLTQLFGSQFHHIIPFYSCCAVYLDDKGVPIEVTRDQEDFDVKGNISKRLVLLLRSASHFTQNTRQLLGVQAQRNAHLEQLGYTLIEIHVPEFYCLPPENVLKSHLSPHIDFSLPEVQQLLAANQAEQDQMDENPTWSLNIEEGEESDANLDDE